MIDGRPASILIGPRRRSLVESARAKRAGHRHSLAQELARVRALVSHVAGEVSHSYQAGHSIATAPVAACRPAGLAISGSQLSTHFIHCLTTSPLLACPIEPSHRSSEDRE